MERTAGKGGFGAGLAYGVGIKSVEPLGGDGRKRRCGDSR